MKRFSLVLAVLLIAGGVAVTSCGSRANSSAETKKECCSDHAKADKNCCSDSAKAGAVDSTKKAGCCDGEKQKEPCQQPCNHKHN